jgi:hypothetical protein
VLLLVAVVVAAVAGGLLRRPAGGHGARPHLRHLPALVAGGGLLAASVVVPDGAATVVRGLGFAGMAWFAGRNRDVTGVAVAGLGAVANLAGIVLNNGVPVRAEALVDAGVAPAAQVREHELDEPYHLQQESDRFAWLGAVVPVSPTEQVLTFGDLLILVGAFDTLRDLSRRRARLPHPAEGGDADGTADGEPTDEDDAQPDSTQASADQDWGAAPSGSAESGSQCSEKRDLTTAEAMDFWKDAAISPSPAHLAARHDK